MIPRVCWYWVNTFNAKNVSLVIGNDSSGYVGIRRKVKTELPRLNLACERGTVGSFE